MCDAVALITAATSTALNIAQQAQWVEILLLVERIRRADTGHGVGHERLPFRCSHGQPRDRAALNEADIPQVGFHFR